MVREIDATKIRGVNFTVGEINPTGTTRLNGECYFYATRVYNAYYNDYAEGFIPIESLTYDKCKNRIVEINSDGKIQITSPLSKRCIGIVSDSYGHLIGASEEEVLSNNKIPIGIAGTLYVDSEDVVSIDNIGKFICSGKEGKARVLEESIDGIIVGKIIGIDEVNNRYRVILLLK